MSVNNNFIADQVGDIKANWDRIRKEEAGARAQAEKQREQDGAANGVAVTNKAPVPAHNEPGHYIPMGY